MASDLYYKLHAHFTHTENNCHLYKISPCAQIQQQRVVKAALSKKENIWRSKE